MQGKLNAYATTMMGRPIMRTTTTHTYTTTKREEAPKHSTPKVCTNNAGFNLWQWFRKKNKKVLDK